MFSNLCPTLPRLLTPNFVQVWLYEPYFCEKYFVFTHIPTKFTTERNEFKLFTKSVPDLNQPTNENICFFIYHWHAGIYNPLAWNWPSNFNDYENYKKHCSKKLSVTKWCKAKYIVYDWNPIFFTAMHSSSDQHVRRDAQGALRAKH